MQGNIEANLSTMSPVNMAILFGGIALLLIVTAFIVRKLGIKNLGPIKLEQHNQTTMHNMNEATKDSDDLCRRQMRQITSNMKFHISNTFADSNICSIARVALSSAIRFPLYESVANNHFTRELMPENYESYRERIAEMMKDEYESLSSVTKEIHCNKETLPSWDMISKQLVDCIDRWMKRISREVMINCERKIQIYKKYEIEFALSKDEYRLHIVKTCIDKNEGYIAVLKRRI